MTDDDTNYIVSGRQLTEYGNMAFDYGVAFRGTDRVARARRRAEFSKFDQLIRYRSIVGKACGMAISTSDGGEHLIARIRNIHDHHAPIQLDRTEQVQIAMAVVTASPENVRAVISALYKNHPHIVREIVCEDCPESGSAPPTQSQRPNPEDSRKGRDRFIPVAIQGMARVHVLKCWPQFFTPIVEGRRTFEVRTWDRDFRLGDLLLLREWDPNTKEYTKHVIYVEVMYILDDEFGIEGKCVMAIKPISPEYTSL